MVGKELDGNEIRFAGTDAHNITDDRVDEVVGVASSTPDHIIRKRSICLKMA